MRGDLVQQRIHNRTTQAFIDENPHTFYFERRDKIPQPDGGFRLSDPRSLSPQVGRRIRNNRMANSRTLPDGRIVVPEFTLVFLRGVDAKAGDIVRMDDVPYEVIIAQESPWAANIDVARHGG